MNLVVREIFGGKPSGRTYIGGVSATISTPALLATKLGISETRIKNFSVVGSDIQCRIIGNYVMPTWINNTELTYIIDADGLVTNSGSFKATTKFLYLYFPGIITQTYQAFFQDKLNGFKLEMPNCTSLPNNFFGNLGMTTNETTLIVPRCTNFGTTKLNNSVFNIWMDGKVYAPISEQTSNSGGVEGDLAYAISNGATVSYVTNYTAPNPITDLSVGTITSTTIQANFTAPTGSTNVIDFYECWVNGVKKNNITASGQTITGLTTGTYYSIVLIAVDIFYNKSINSNVVTATTT